jgi:hypothetical protein
MMMIRTDRLAGCHTARNSETSILESLRKEMTTNVTYENDQVTKGMEVNFA